MDTIERQTYLFTLAPITPLSLLTYLLPTKFSTHTHTLAQQCRESRDHRVAVTRDRLWSGG